MVSLYIKTKPLLEPFCFEPKKGVPCRSINGDFFSKKCRWGFFSGDSSDLNVHRDLFFSFNNYAKTEELISLTKSSREKQLENSCQL